MSSASVPPPAPRPSAAHAAARVGALVSGALVAVAAFLPWVYVTLPLDPTRRATDSGVEVGLHGVLTLVAAVVVVSLVTVGRRAALFGAAGASGIVALVAAQDLADFLRPDSDLGGLLGMLESAFDPAYGLWLTLAGGVGALACALLAAMTTPKAAVATIPSAIPSTAPAEPPA